MSQFPVHIVSFLLGRARLFLPVGNVNVLPWLVEDAVRLLLLILSSAVIFLSCGTAILFGRRPRAGDGLQIPSIAKTFKDNFPILAAADGCQVCDPRTRELRGNAKLLPLAQPVYT
jgi:hypothetical protein